MKRFLSLILAALMIAAAAALAVPAAAAKASPFDDVKETRWSYSSIINAVNSGYMKGTGERKFSPSGTLTRAMVATVLWRRQGEPAPTAPSGFSDVPEGKWYFDAVAWAKETGVVQGVSETKFNPEANVTREQLATMLFRFSETAPVCVPERADLGVFPDGSSVHDWAREAMGWAVEAALVKGSSDGSLDPSGYATREQFAAIIERFDNTFKLEYNDPVPFSHYTEKPYPLVENADVYVAVDGDDSADGSFERPFATFQRAVLRVRELKKTVTDRSIVVAFKAGTYYTENVTMTQEDSGTKEYPVIYCGYGDGEAVVTGGAVIPEDSFGPVDEDKKAWFAPTAVDKIKKVDLGGILPEFSDSDVIFSERGTLWLARYPNKTPELTDNFFGQFGRALSDHEIGIGHPRLIRRLNDVYRTTDGLKLYGYLTTGWFKDTLDTDGYRIDEETGYYAFNIPHPEKARMGSLRYNEFPWWEYFEVCILNMSEDLDADGEYWVDTDDLALYVYDPRGTYTIPVKDKAIVMAGCDWVTFRGLTVTGYRSRILDAAAIRGLTVDRCRFSVCSSQIAMTVRGREGADFDTKITECDFSVFAGRVLEVSGFCGIPSTTGERCNFLFDNNRVTLTNLTIEWNAAVYVAGCNAAVLSHNEFEDCSYMAITYGGCDTVIEYNTFKHCMFNSQDGGAIYCGNAQTDWHNVIRYNLFYPDSKWFSVYLDDNEPGAEIYGNLFMHGTVCVHNGRSNNVHDNLMIRSGVSLAVSDVINLLNRYGESGDPSEILNNDFYRSWRGFLRSLDADPAIRELYAAKSPDIATLTYDVERAAEEDFVLYPKNYIRDNWYFTENGIEEEIGDGYSVAEGNRFFCLSDNPVFVNPTVGDYRIKDGSGFPDIRFELIGRY